MQVRKDRCPFHPKVIYDLRYGCQECEEERFQETLDKLDRKEEEMTWE